MRAVPGHDGWVIYPYKGNYRQSADFCRTMGERCGVKVEVELEEKSRTPAFWTFLMESVGGVPGQKATWRGPSQWTDPINRHGDRIGIYVGHPDRLWLYVRAGESKASETRFARMRRCSRMILEQMADQNVGDDVERNCEKGWSVSVERSWVRDDENEWPEAALWIKDQHDRLLAIAGDTSQVRQGHANRTNPQRPKDGTKTGRVWALADRHRTRKATIAAAVAEGINSGTARAQFVRWQRAQREPTPKV